MLDIFAYNSLKLWKVKWIESKETSSDFDYIFFNVHHRLYWSLYCQLLSQMVTCLSFLRRLPEKFQLGNLPGRWVYLTKITSVFGTKNGYRSSAIDKESLLEFYFNFVKLLLFKKHKQNKLHKQAINNLQD